MSDVKLVAYSDRLRTAVDRVMGAQVTSVAGSTKRPGRSTFTDRGGASDASTEYNGYFKIVDASETTTNEDGTTNTVFKIAVVDGSDSLYPENTWAGGVRIKDFNTHNVYMRNWTSEDLAVVSKGKEYLHVYLRYFYPEDSLNIKVFPHDYATFTGPQDTFGESYVYLGVVRLSKNAEGNISLSITQYYNKNFNEIDRTVVDTYNGYFKIVDTSQLSVSTEDFSESITHSIAIVDGATYDKAEGICEDMQCKVNRASYLVKKWSHDTEADAIIAIKYSAPKTVIDDSGYQSTQSAKVEIVNLATHDPPYNRLPNDSRDYSWLQIGRLIFKDKVMTIAQDFTGGVPNIEWWSVCGDFDEDEEDLWNDEQH